MKSAICACILVLAAAMTRPPAPPDSGDAASALVGTLGGLRTLVADLLWVRAERIRAERRYGELLPLYASIANLVPRVPEIWYVHGYTLAYDVPFREKDEARVWGWVRQGYLRLTLGLEVNPGDPFLHYARGFLAYHRIGLHPDLAARFGADPALDPTGAGPLSAAARDLRVARLGPGHGSMVDIASLQVLERLKASAAPEDVVGFLAEQREIIAHLDAAHPRSAAVAARWRGLLGD